MDNKNFFNFQFIVVLFLILVLNLILEDIYFFLEYLYKLFVLI